MKTQRLLFLVPIAFFGLIVERGHADDRVTLESAKLYQTPAAKIYRARVLLEDARFWREAYELLREVVKNDSEQLNPTSLSKVKRAILMIRGYLPAETARSILQIRRLFRPFVQAQYLLNEALMDARIEINAASDSETTLINALLKSYFFPGFESYGEVIYPEPNTYSFDIYAATPQNITRAATAPSAEPLPEGASISDLTNKGSLDRLELEKRVADIQDAEDQAQKSRQGLLDNLLGSGLSLQDIQTISAEVGKAVQELVKLMAADPRYTNRYNEMSMLVQALAEPGSVVLDPQIQDFIRGVKLKMRIGEVNRPTAAEIEWLKQAFGEDLMSDSGDGVRIRIGELLKRDHPHLATQAELVVEPGADTSTLYVITGIGGTDLYMMRLYQSVALAMRDAHKIHLLMEKGQVALKASGVIEKVGTWAEELSKTLNVSESRTTVAAVFNFLSKGGLKTISAASNTLLTTGETLAKSTHLQKVGEKLVHSKFVKSGGLLTAVTLVAVAAEITTGAVEYSRSSDADERKDIWVDTNARVAASLTYLLPFVGWGAAALDGMHTLFGFPFDTADLYRSVGALGENSVYWWYGYGFNRVGVKLANLEVNFNAPRSPILLDRYAKEATSVADADKKLISIQQDVQEGALSLLSLLYVAHRSVVPNASYAFGSRIVDYLDQYSKYRHHSHDLIRAHTARRAILLKAEKDPPTPPAASQPAEPRTISLP